MTESSIPPGQYNIMIVDQSTTHWKCKIVKGQYKGRCFWLKKDKYLLEAEVNRYRKMIESDKEPPQYTEG